MQNLALIARITLIIKDSLCQSNGKWSHLSLLQMSNTHLLTLAHLAAEGIVLITVFDVNAIYWTIFKDKCNSNVIHFDNE